MPSFDGLTCDLVAMHGTVFGLVSQTQLVQYLTGILAREEPWIQQLARDEVSNFATHNVRI